MRRNSSMRRLAAALLLFAACATGPERRGGATADRAVIVVVWDGLRPDTIDAALRTGFELIRERQAASMQAANRAAGVRWTWLAFALP